MEHESPELSEVATLLEEHRARLTDSELDRIQRRVTASRPSIASAPARRPSAAMRGRAAITSMLAAGFLMTGGGAALGVSALSETHSANAAQYGTAPGTPGAGGVTGAGDAGAGGVAGAGDAGAGAVGANNPNAGAPAGGTLGASPQGAGDRGGAPPEAQAQSARQLEAGGSELPFTGYVAAFVLLAGLGTLAVGLTLRRGTRQVPLQP